jgi:hypothetical protein
VSKHLADCRKPYPRSREFLTKLANRPAKSLADTISSDALPIVAELRTPPPNCFRRCCTHFSNEYTAARRSVATTDSQERLAAARRDFAVVRSSVA